MTHPLVHGTDAAGRLLCGRVEAAPQVAQRLLELTCLQCLAALETLQAGAMLEHKLMGLLAPAIDRTVARGMAQLREVLADELQAVVRTLVQQHVANNTQKGTGHGPCPTTRSTC